MSDDVADPQPKIFSSNFVISIKKNIKQKVKKQKRIYFQMRNKLVYNT